jgi:hypothetical protein
MAKNGEWNVAMPSRNGPPMVRGYKMRRYVERCVCLVGTFYSSLRRVGKQPVVSKGVRSAFPNPDL